MESNIDNKIFQSGDLALIVGITRLGGEDVATLEIKEGNEQLICFRYSEDVEILLKAVEKFKDLQKLVESLDKW